MLLRLQPVSHHYPCVYFEHLVNDYLFVHFILTESWSNLSRTQTQSQNICLNLVHLVRYQWVTSGMGGSIIHPQTSAVSSAAFVWTTVSTLWLCQKDAWNHSSPLPCLGMVHCTRADMNAARDHLLKRAWACFTRCVLGNETVLFTLINGIRLWDQACENILKPMCRTCKCVTKLPQTSK